MPKALKQSSMPSSSFPCSCAITNPGRGRRDVPTCRAGTETLRFGLRRKGPKDNEKSFTIGARPISVKTNRRWHCLFIGQTLGQPLRRHRLDGRWRDRRLTSIQDNIWLWAQPIASRDLSNRGHPMAAILTTLMLRGKSIGVATPPHRVSTNEDDTGTRGNFPSPFPRRRLPGHARWRESNKAPSRSPALPA
jgi:hypothetical protein